MIFDDWKWNLVALVLNAVASGCGVYVAFWWNGV